MLNAVSVVERQRAGHPGEEWERKAGISDAPEVDQGRSQTPKALSARQTKRSARVPITAFVLWSRKNVYMNSGAVQGRRYRGFREISRMARSTLQVQEILHHCVDIGINVHVAKQKMILDGSMQARIATNLDAAADRLW